MTEERFNFRRFDVDVENINEITLYEIDNNPSDDLDESNLFYLYSTTDANVQDIVDKLNNQEERIKELEKENRGLQFKIIDMLDFVKEKGTVTREEIKKWWNGGMAEKRYKRLVSSIDYYYCIDNQNENQGLTEKDMLNRLNEQDDEIKSLKKENEHIETCFKMADSTYHMLLKQYQNIEITLSKYRKENEKLKKELFEARKDYLIETYSDNPTRRDEKIQGLKEEFKERFGDSE